MTDFDPNDFFIKEAKKHSDWVQRASQSPLVDIYGIASPIGTGMIWSKEIGTRMILHLLAWKKQDGPVVNDELRLEMLFESKDAIAPDHTIQPYGVVHIRTKLAEDADGKICGLLEEIVASKIRNTELEHLASDLKDPLFFKDPKFGILKYDRAHNYYSGQKTRKRMKIQTEFRVEHSDQIKNGLSHLNKIWDTINDLEKRSHSYACDELLETLNKSWIEKDKQPVSNKQFLKRIKLIGISINTDGSFELLYDDDNLFLGHTIEVRFNPDHSISETCISG